MAFEDQESVTKRIDAILERDYHGDEVTKNLCHQAAHWARGYWPGHDAPDVLATFAEHMAAQSDALRASGTVVLPKPLTNAGKIAFVRAELDRPLPSRKP